MLGRLISLIFHTVTSTSFLAGVAVGAAIGGAAIVGFFKSAEKYVVSRF